MHFASGDALLVSPAVVVLFSGGTDGTILLWGLALAAPKVFDSCGGTRAVREEQWAQPLLRCVACRRVGAATLAPHRVVSIASAFVPAQFTTANGPATCMHPAKRTTVADISLCSCQCILVVGVGPFVLIFGIGIVELAGLSAGCCDRAAVLQPIGSLDQQIAHPHDVVAVACSIRLTAFLT